MTDLRGASANDLSAILDLNNAAQPAVSELNPASLEALTVDSTALVVAEGPEKVVGFLLLLAGPGLDYDSLNYRWFSSRYDKFLYVDRVVVAPSAQRTGLGRRFYEYALALAEGDYGLLCAEVNTRPRNDGSLAFHDALGFETVGSQDTEGGSKTVRMYAKVLEPGVG